jgi:hypothetical protein
VGLQYVLQGGNLVKNKMVKASQVSDVAHGPLFSQTNIDVEDIFNYHDFV